MLWQTPNTNIWIVASTKSVHYCPFCWGKWCSQNNDTLYTLQFSYLSSLLEPLNLKIVFAHLAYASFILSENKTNIFSSTSRKINWYLLILVLVGVRGAKLGSGRAAYVQDIVRRTQTQHGLREAHNQHLLSRHAGIYCKNTFQHGHGSAKVSPSSCLLKINLDFVNIFADNTKQKNDPSADSWSTWERCCPCFSCICSCARASPTSPTSISSWTWPILWSNDFLPLVSWPNHKGQTNLYDFLSNAADRIQQSVIFNFSGLFLFKRIIILSVTTSLGSLHSYSCVAFPRRPVQSSQIRTNYRNEFAQSLEPWVGKGGGQILSHIIPTQDTNFEHTTVPLPQQPSHPPPSKRQHSALRTKAMEGEGPFSNHCRSVALKCKCRCRNLCSRHH